MLLPSAVLLANSAASLNSELSTVNWHYTQIQYLELLLGPTLPVQRLG